MRLLPFLLFVVSLTANAQDDQPSFEKLMAQHREQYKAEFLSSKASPLQSEKAVSLLRFYPADLKYRITASVKRISAAEPVNFATSAARKKAVEIPYALLSFYVDDKPCQLTVYRSLTQANNPLYRDYLFLPFTDATSGQKTYGGGRYLDVRISEIKDGQLLLDFNKAYNPYCAYKAGYVCPIPPASNWLPVAIKAGELLYAAVH